MKSNKDHLILDNLAFFTLCRGEFHREDQTEAGKKPYVCVMEARKAKACRQETRHLIALQLKKKVVRTSFLFYAPASWSRKKRKQKR